MRAYDSLMNEVARAFVPTGPLSKELARYHLVRRHHTMDHGGLKGRARV